MFWVWALSWTSWSALWLVCLLTHGSATDLGARGAMALASLALMKLENRR